MTAVECCITYVHVHPESQQISTALSLQTVTKILYLSPPPLLSPSFRVGVM